MNFRIWEVYEARYMSDKLQTQLRSGFLKNEISATMPCSSLVIYTKWCIIGETVHIIASGFLTPFRYISQPNINEWLFSINQGEGVLTILLLNSLLIGNFGIRLSKWTHIKWTHIKWTHALLKEIKDGMASDVSR